ncbi:nitroreductase family protein [uncultured Muribaculum sp.]|uniref:nitroreductase family protein n=1 Tax=uncultured Muribaculum sp. TaxID=1918613 RepID=UPI0025DC359B|nr:nitroreductase family protein [uncultured Muribaculum sp.]
MTAQEKQLPAPATTGGMPINEVVAKRHSIREFDKKHAIDDATLGQLLWMTAGVNRHDAQPSAFGAPVNRCNPTARNWQEIRTFVFGEKGVWEYIPATHVLSPVADGDYRTLVAGTKEFSQDFVTDAPYSIVFVADLTGLPEGEQVKAMAMVDTGIACENLNLACTSLGVATVPRATMDIVGISRLLCLTERQLPVMNNPIGYPRK